MSKDGQDSFLRQALRTIWAVLRNYFILIGILVTILSIISVFSLMRAMRSVSSFSITESLGSHDGPIVLDVTANGRIEGSGSRLSELSELFGGKKGLSFSNLHSALRRAARDDRVKGIIVRYVDLSASRSSFSELHRWLKLYREQSGKKVYLHLASASNGSFALSSAADRVALTPAGSMMIPGPMIVLTYFGDALNRLGVDFEVFRTGGFKSALEPFSRNGPSTQSRKMYQSLEASQRQLLVEKIAMGRNQPPEKVTAWLNQGFFLAQDALNAGMVDEITYYEDFKVAALDVFAKESGLESIAAEDLLNPSEYLDVSSDVESDRSSDSEDGVALIQANGQILMSSDTGGNEGITPIPLIEELHWALKDKNVKAVVMAVDSPGGSATASDMIWSEVKRLNSVKPVIVAMRDVAASGGYYIACAATKIIAEPDTLTGSIGVISGIPTLSRFPKNYGINFETITQSDRKDLVDPGKKPNSRDRNLMVTSIKSVYQTFLSRVAEGRKMEVARVHELAQGRVYTGEQALELGLIDQLGGVYEAFQLAKEAGGLDPTKLHPVHTYNARGFDLSRCLEDTWSMMRCLREIEGRSSISTGKNTIFRSSVLFGALNYRTFANLTDQTSRALDMLASGHALAWLPMLREGNVTTILH